jgi:hypothetical protein
MISYFELREINSQLKGASSFKNGKEGQAITNPARIDAFG